MVANGLVAGAITALSWLVRPPFQQKSTASISDAYDWCTSLLTSEERAGIPSHAVLEACLIKGRQRTAPTAGRSA